MKTKAVALLATSALGVYLMRRRWSGAEYSFDGRVALVTGGSRGLGFLIARELARRGCRVAICARDEAELNRAQEALAGDNRVILALRCDVSRREDVERMVDRVVENLGAVDVLVNNAGIIQVGPERSITLADYEQAIGVMYWGTVYTTLAVLPSMLQRRSGRIVNITSIGGKVAVPHLLPYTAAKFAATGFSEGLRAELSGTGVYATTVAPGLMRTGSYVNAIFKGRHEDELNWFSLGAALPLVSMDAERAARQIVDAAGRGEAERILSVPASLLATAHGLFPGVSADALGLGARLLLPGAGGPDGAGEPGAKIAREHPSVLRERLTALGRSAAERFHELPGPGGMT